MESEINLVLEERMNTPPQKSTAISKGSAHHTDDATQAKVCLLCQGVDCKLEWDAFGCVELYKENTPDERRETLRQNKLCFTCGSEHILKQGQRRHACAWKNKSPVKCLGANCSYGAITCLNHYKQRNMTPELVRWIKSTKINTKHLGFMIDFDPKRCPKKQIGKRCPKKQIGKPLANNVSKGSKKKVKANKKKNKPAVSGQDERRMLQEGLISKDISDDDLVPFFENDLKASEDNPDVRGIPPGETVFIMCVLKGKTRPVTAFIDSGCNCFVAREDVVKEELNAIKVSDGPIPMGVAGGKTVNASGGLAATLPLLDGGHKVVKGLTMDNGQADIRHAKSQPSQVVRCM